MGRAPGGSAGCSSIGSRATYPPKFPRSPRAPDPDRYDAQRRSHPAVVDPARPRSVAPRHDRRPRRPHRRLDPHDPPRPRSAPVGRISLFDEVHEGKQVLDARAARVPASRRDGVHPRRADARCTSRDRSSSASRRRRSSATFAAPSTSSRARSRRACGSSSTGCRS